MMIGRSMAMGLALTALVATTASAASPPDSARKDQTRDSCIYITQLGPSHPLGDRAVIFRANVSDYYRLDFAQQCMLTYPQPKLILKPVGGIGSICSALDVDVSVGEQGPESIATPCIPSAWHKMTPAEVAAIPKADLP